MGEHACAVFTDPDGSQAGCICGWLSDETRDTYEGAALDASKHVATADRPKEGEDDASA